MADLQDAIDRSLASATPFTRSIFASDAWDAARVAGFVNAVRNLTAATVGPTGAPHAAVVIAACHAQQIHFSVAPESVLARNLARGSRLAFTLAEKSHAVMGQGSAVLAGRSPQDVELIERLAAASRSGRFTTPGWEGLIYRIEIDRIFAS